jgi:hypothetical protein
VTTWLDVTVAKPKEQGRAEVTIVVSVEGPPGVQVEKSGIDDGVIAWEVSFGEPTLKKGDTVLWTQTIALKQKKLGPVPLPVVKVSFREGPDAAPETVEWPDLLRQVRGLPTPVEVPEPPSTARRWRAAGAVAVTVAAILIVVVAVLTRRRRKPQPVLTPEQRAARALDAAMALTDGVAAHERMADAVRSFFAERLSVPAQRQTTVEFLAAVRREGALPAERCLALREFFERCDLVKFAGVRPAPEECQRTAELARELVRETANANPAAATPTLGR